MKKKEWIGYVCVIIGSILICMFFNKFFFGDFSVPFNYQDGDNILTPLSVKRIINNEYFTTSRMGAPYQSDFFFFPTYADLFSVLLIKLMGLFTKNWGLIVNLYYIFTFISIAVSSYYVMRNFRVQAGIAVGASLCFTALPYHFLRNTMHLFLSFYAQIPIYVLLVYWLCTDELFWIFGKGFLKNRKNIVTIILLPIIALSGIYYSFFGCFLLLIALIVKTGKKQNIWKSILQVGSMIGFICSWILIASLPYKIAALRSSEVAELPTRDYASAEYLGLKITQLFWPNGSHGLGFLEELFQRYSNAPLPNEGSEYLGIYGILGFVCLILVAFGLKIWKNNESLGILSKLNVGTVLLSTIGGFGSIFAVLISPQIRAYNRISVFIAFLSILGISILCTELYEGMGKIWKKVFLAACLLIIGVSIYEQSSSVTKNYNNGYIGSYYSDQAFVQQIEAELEEGDAVFQYPYLAFPESPSVNRMGDYALARGYLHSDSLNWSYGAYRGTSGDLWRRSLTELSYEEQINRIMQEEFAGIYIDQYAYEEAELTELCQAIEANAQVGEKLVSSDGRLLFYKIN